MKDDAGGNRRQHDREAEFAAVCRRLNGDDIVERIGARPGATERRRHRAARPRGTVAEKEARQHQSDAGKRHQPVAPGRRTAPPPASQNLSGKKHDLPGVAEPMKSATRRRAPGTGRRS